MPQLDKLVMISQFFWLVFFFLGLYFILLKDILPRILRIRILRKNLNLKENLKDIEIAKGDFAIPSAKDVGLNKEISEPAQWSNLQYCASLVKGFRNHSKYCGKLGFVSIKRRKEETLYNNLKLSTWNFYFNIRENIFHYEEGTKLNLKSLTTWILSKDVIEKVWSKEVNFYGLSNIASSHTVNFKSYDVASKIIAKL